jgi:hypothetical protein
LLGSTPDFFVHCRHAATDIGALLRGRLTKPGPVPGFWRRCRRQNTSTGEVRQADAR